MVVLRGWSTSVKSASSLPTTNAIGLLLNATEVDRDKRSQCVILSLFKQYILHLNPVCALHFYAV